MQFKITTSNSGLRFVPFGDLSWSRDRLPGPAIVLLAAAVATAPQIFRGNTCGHDFDFHLVSWLDCVQAWEHGIAYPHWSPSANFGAGEPRYIFYPPVTWMLGAGLGLVLPWPLVPMALTFLLLAATGLGTRALARQWLARGPATLAGCTALFSGYALFTAYERSAFGELAGGFWMPMLLLAAMRKGDGGRRWFHACDGRAVWLALMLAGAWLSNAPAGVMASYLLAAVALTEGLMNRCQVGVLRAALAACLGLGLCAFYLFPAAVEQRWVDIRQATNDPGERIENSFLFSTHPGAGLVLHDLELNRVSRIAVLMLGVTLMGALIAWRRNTLPADRSRWIPLALIPIAVLALQFPFSLPLWNLLPKLRFLQFPWRWLVAVEAPLGIFFAAAVWPRVTAGRWLRFALMAACSMLFLGSTWAAGRFFFQTCDDQDAVAPMVQAFRSGFGFQGTDEYEPPGADDTMVATGLPDACLVTDPDTTLGVMDTPGANPDWWMEQHSCDAALSFDRQSKGTSPEHLRLRTDLKEDGYLVLRLRTYPAWRLMLNGQPAPPLVRRDDGLMEVPVQRGALNLAVDWTTTGDVMLGRWISFLSWLVAGAVWWVSRRGPARVPGL